MRRKLPLVIVAVLIISGIAVLLYPHISKLIFDWQTKKDVKTFETGQEYGELYDAFERYNKWLSSGGQSALNSEASYAAFPVDPTEYGMDEEVIGYIEIPCQDILLKLYLGANEETLYKGAGIMGYTSAPIGGADTNCVIASHNTWNGALRFKNINKLNPGDMVYITNPWETRTYEVFDRMIIEPDNVSSIYIKPGEDIITLMTCDSYGPDGPDRCIVYCRFVEKN